MKNDPFHQTLDRAAAALEHISKDEIQHLTLLECAFALDALPTTNPFANTCTQLAERLYQQLNPVWISDGDLFEVFLVLETLWKYDPLRVSGAHLAYAIQRLVRSEVQVGGPYKCNGVVDIATNLQIASFVQMVAKPLPGLNAFFDEIITAGNLENTVLGRPYVLYLLAKLSNRPEVTRLASNYPSKTPVCRAVALTALQHSTPISQQEIRTICSLQQPTGRWHEETLLNEQLNSSVATTALIAKALMTYQSDNSPVKSQPGLQRRHQLVAQVTKQLFEKCTDPLRQSTLAAVDKICSTERTFEITLLSYFFAQALKHPIRLTDQQFAMLGAANVCGWIAYTIYDDFLDDEGVAAQLPVANITMRTSLDCFQGALPRQQAFGRYVARIFTEMDEANAWEVHNCRFIVKGNTIIIGKLPKYGRQAMLAARSFAHILGPMAVLSYSQSNPQQLHHIESAFRHYLIARQLNDDLHDWVNDMQAGQASYVVIAILRDIHLPGGTYDLSILLSTMQKQFRRTTMPHVCLLALRHISQAKQNFIKSELLQTNNSVYTFLDELEISLRYSLDQHSKAKALVETPVSYSS